MSCDDFDDISEAIALPTSFELIQLTEEQRVISRNLRHDHSFYFSGYNDTLVLASEIGREDTSHSSFDVASQVKNSDANSVVCQSDNAYDSLLLNIGRPCEKDHDQRIQRYSEIRSLFTKLTVSHWATNEERCTLGSFKSEFDETSLDQNEGMSKSCDDFVWTVEVTADRAQRAQIAKNLGRVLRSQRKQLRSRSKRTRSTRQNFLQISRCSEQQQRKTLRKMRKYKRRKGSQATMKMKLKLNVKKMIIKVKKSTVAALNTSERDLEKSGRVFVAKFNAVRKLMRTESVDEAFDSVLARLTDSPAVSSSLNSPPVGDLAENKPILSHCTLSKVNETAAELTGTINSCVVPSSKRVSILFAKREPCAADDGDQRATSLLRCTSSRIALATTPNAGSQGNQQRIRSVRNKMPVAADLQSTLTSATRKQSRKECALKNKSTDVQHCRKTGAPTRRKPISSSSSTAHSAKGIPMKIVLNEKSQNQSMPVSMSMPVSIIHLNSNGNQCPKSIDLQIGAPPVKLARRGRPAQVLLNVSNLDGQFDQDEYYSNSDELSHNKENEAPEQVAVTGSDLTSLPQSASHNANLPLQIGNPVFCTVSSRTSRSTSKTISSRDLVSLRTEAPCTSARLSSCVAHPTFCPYCHIQTAYNTRARARAMCQCSHLTSDLRQPLEIVSDSTTQHLESLPESKKCVIQATGINLADRDEESMIEVPRMRVASTCIIKQSEAYVDPEVMDITSQSLCTSVEEPHEVTEDDQRSHRNASQLSADSAPSRSPAVLPRLTRSDFQMPERSASRNSRFRVSSQSIIFRSDAISSNKFVHNANEASQSSGFLHRDAVQLYTQSDPFSTPTAKDRVDENANVSQPSKQSAQSSDAKSTAHRTRHKRKSEAELLLLSASLTDTPKGSAALSREDKKAQSWMRAFEKVEQGSTRKRPTRRLTYIRSVPDSGTDSDSHLAPIQYGDLRHLADALESIAYLGEQLEVTAVCRELQSGQLAYQSRVARCVYMTATLCVVVPECQTFSIEPFTPVQCQVETLTLQTTLDTVLLHRVCILHHTLNELKNSGVEALQPKLVTTDTQQKAKAVLQIESDLDSSLKDKWKSPMGAYQNRAQKMALLAARKSKQQLPSENETSNSADCRVGSSSKPITATKRSDRNPNVSGSRAVAKRATRSRSKRSDSVASAFGSSFRNGSATQNSNMPFSELGTIQQGGLSGVASGSKQLANQPKSTLTNGLFQQSPSADVVCRKRKATVQSHVPDVPAKKPHEDPERKRQMLVADELGEIIADDRCDCVSHAHNLYDGRLLSRAERQRLIEKWLTDADVIESTRNVVEWQLKASAAPSENTC